MAELWEGAKALIRQGLDLKSQDDAPRLQAQLLRGLAAFDTASHAAGCSSAMIEDARYALCAWLDERIFRDSPLSIAWLEWSLVMREFQDAAAGSGFFERLERLRRNPLQKPVLEVYLDCLLLGFQGRFSLEDPAALACLIDEISSDAAKPPGFQARERATGERLPAPRLNLPKRLAIVAPALAIFLYFVLAFLAQHFH